MTKLTKEQQRACFKKWQTSGENISYLAFRRRCFIAFKDCLIIPNWHGMYIGVEEDGYAHS